MDLDYIYYLLVRREAIFMYMLLLFLLKYNLRDCHGLGAQRWYASTPQVYTK